MDAKMYPAPVLAEPFTRSMSTVAAYAAEITDAKNTSSILRVLQSTFTFDDLKHCKRIRRSIQDKTMHVLLCSKKEVTSADQLETKLKSILSDRLQQCLRSPYTVQVPAFAPITRAQFQEASNSWPVIFHENKELERAIAGKLFSSEENLLISKLLEVAISTGLQSKSENKVGVVVTRARSDEVLTSNFGNTQEHPLNHAVMMAIDAVAQQHRGNRDAALDEENPPKRPRVDNADYLLTGLDVYISHEPCPMCCMALIHSRVGRVFYDKDTSCGGFRTGYQIHTIPSLNHHFQVYRMCPES
eukprot:m.131199 g.131199  ORF g.131199 m.131199 type:complete len:301 (-) comp14616_c0_seq5:1800-2702(-)